MNWLIIGSTAQYHWFPDSRKPTDIDLLTPAKIVGNESKVCVVDCQWHDLAERIIEMNCDPVFADPNILFTLKVSHSHWDIHFDKTLFDIKFLQDKKCNLYPALYHDLVKMWEKIHGEKKAYLDVTVDEFFSETVKREYDHDFLHECVAFNGRPMHEFIRPDLTKAWCSEEMFSVLSNEHQAQTALEEIIVTAIERSGLSMNSSKIDRIRALKKAHRLLCTSMTKGWFARYLILNHFDLLYTRKEQCLNQIAVALSKL